MANAIFVMLLPTHINICNNPLCTKRPIFLVFKEACPLINGICFSYGGIRCHQSSMYLRARTERRQG